MPVPLFATKLKNELLEELTPVAAGAQGVYTSVAAGESATVNGEYFGVAADGYYTLYENVAGTGMSRGSLIAAATLAATGGAAQVGFIQEGTGAVASTLQAKAREVVSVSDFGATGDGVTDDSTNVQKAIDALSSGGSVRFPRGSYKLGTGLTVSNDDVTLEFEAGASISYTTATLTPITLAGDRCKVSGGKINAPATFDGTNSAITYSVVKVTGDYCAIDGLYLDNVPRAGIWFENATNGIVSNCVIDGGTAEGFFTGINTVHFGIVIDTPSTGSQGNFVISGNIIRRCTQGAGSGSVGAATFEQSITIIGNVFELCWNHGWYSSGLANGHTITGNAFNACQIPIAATGSDHVITGNSLQVQTTGTAVNTDNEMTGISLRDPVRCVVSNNVIKGEGINGGVVISLDDNSGVPGNNKVTDNVVSGNVITITNSAAAGVVAIRLFGNSTEVSNNMVTGNTITAPVRSGDGLIVVQGSAASTKNHVQNNSLTMTRVQGSYFVFLSEASHTQVSGNTFELAADAASALTFIAIGLVSCSNTRVDNNDFICSSAWGANVAYRTLQELTTATNNSASGNRINLDLAKLTSVTLFLALNTGPFLLDHAGTGSPEGSLVAGPGSIWRRTDGAAGTTLYIKETGNSNTGWRQMGKAAAPTTTYAAPTGGATTDAECRASLAQLASDVADLKTKLAAAVLTA